MSHTPNHESKVGAVLMILEQVRSPLTVEAVSDMLGILGFPSGVPATSAFIRDLRKPKYGGHKISSWRSHDGTFVYQLQEDPKG